MQYFPSAGAVRVLIKTLIQGIAIGAPIRIIYDKAHSKTTDGDSTGGAEPVPEKEEGGGRDFPVLIIVASVGACWYIYRHCQNSRSKRLLAEAEAETVRFRLGAIFAQQAQGQQRLEALNATEVNQESWMCKIHATGGGIVWVDGKGAAEHLTLLLRLRDPYAPPIAAPLAVKRRWLNTQLYSINAQYNRCVAVNLRVRRDDILFDTLQAFERLDDRELKKSIRVKFVGEEGVDAGGLTREWFQLVGAALFNVESGLFQYTPGDHYGLHINPGSDVASPHHLQYFRLAGRLLGKALLEGHTLPVHLCRLLLLHITRAVLRLHDLQLLDKELWGGVCTLLKPGVEVEALCLDFTAQQSVFGGTRTCDLQPGGGDVELEESNRGAYVRAVAQHHLGGEVSHQLGALLKGLYALVPPELLSIFSAQELLLLLGGEARIDVEEWRRNTTYSGAYSAAGVGQEHEVVGWFWEVVEGMSCSQRQKLLQFVTGCTRVPAAGFAALPGLEDSVRLFSLNPAPCPPAPLLSSFPRAPWNSSSPDAVGGWKEEKHPVMGGEGGSGQRHEQKYTSVEEVPLPVSCTCKCRCDGSFRDAVCGCRCRCPAGARGLPLPCAHTCFNAMDLPLYPSRQILHDRLLLALEHATGFGFC